MGNVRIQQRGKSSTRRSASFADYSSYGGYNGVGPSKQEFSLMAWHRPSHTKFRTGATTHAGRHRSSYQTPRPLPCWLRWPRSTSARKCCFSVLRLAPDILMRSPILTRPCSRANSTICSDSSGSGASTSFSRSTFLLSRRTCSASARRKNSSHGCQFGTLERLDSVGSDHETNTAPNNTHCP